MEHRGGVVPLGAGQGGGEVRVRGRGVVRDEVAFRVKFRVRVRVRG